MENNKSSLGPLALEILCTKHKTDPAKHVIWIDTAYDYFLNSEQYRSHCLDSSNHITTNYVYELRSKDQIQESDKVRTINWKDKSDLLRYVHAELELFDYSFHTTIMNARVPKNFDNYLDLNLHDFIVNLPAMDLRMILTILNEKHPNDFLEWAHDTHELKMSPDYILENYLIKDWKC